MSSDLSLAHDYGLSYATKTIFLFGEINEDTKKEVIVNLHRLDKNSGEVTVILSSGGGCVESGLAIYDAIRAMKNNVRIICYGGVESSASFILQAADEGRRFMLPHSHIMIHIGEEGIVSNHPKNNEAAIKLNKKLTEDMYKIYLDNIKKAKPSYTRKQLEKKLTFDTMMTPNEAIAWGLADEILEVY